MSNKALEAWDATVTGAAQSDYLATFLGLLFFGGLVLFGAWFVNGLFDSYKANNSTFKEVGWYLARYISLLTFFTYYFL